MKGAAKERDPNAKAAREYFQIFNAKSGHVVGLLFVLLDGARDAGGELVRLLILINFTAVWQHFSVYTVPFFFIILLLLANLFTLYSRVHLMNCLRFRFCLYQRCHCCYYCYYVVLIFLQLPLQLLLLSLTRSAQS